MKVAITEWQGRIAPVFDVAGTAWILGDDGEKTSISLPETCAQRKLDLLKEHGVTVLICGAISRRVQDYAESLNLRVNPFISGELDEVWEAWKSGSLNQACYAMPGCGRCRRRRGKCN